MYTKEEREGILWEFHRSGLSAPAACRSLPLFPNKDNLYAWLKLEEAGELTAMRCPTGRSACTARTARVARRGAMRHSAGTWSGKTSEVPSFRTESGKRR